MAKYEVTISAIDFDFSTNINEISADEQSDIVLDVLGRKWTLGVDAERDLAGPLCQKVSNETGCLVREVTYTAKRVR